METKKSILSFVDSYKTSHYKQYPPGSNAMISYFESRGGKRSSVLFFGLQYQIKKYLMNPFTQKEINRAAAIFKKHGVDFNKEGFNYILKEYNGLFPVRVYSVKEGSIIPTKLPLIRLECDDPKAFWCVGWLEDLFMHVWYPTTVASNSAFISEMIRDALNASADDTSGLPWKHHDFGLRGASSYESATIGGLAHLVVSRGTDNVPALYAAQDYYNTEEVVGDSINAAEHSTITSWLRENEAEAYRNMINQFSREGSVYAVVSDSYDIHNAVTNLWGTELKQEVIDAGGILVVRPDSGDPIITPVQVVEKLAEKFGYTKNSKGFKVLNNVRVIQGDGIDDLTIRCILTELLSRGFSADNIAFGQGGALLQLVGRDDQKVAIKCSAIRVNEEWRDVVKDPITDPGKRSKAGRVTTYLMEDGSYKAGVVGWSDKQIEGKDILELVYDGSRKDKQLLIEYTFEEIRDRYQEQRKLIRIS